MSADESHPPLRVVLSAPPGAPGVDALLEAAVTEAQVGTEVRVLLSGRGLDFLDGPWPARWAAAGVRAAICAKSARERGLVPATAPSTVAWSSLAAVARDVGAGARLWSAIA